MPWQTDAMYRRLKRYGKCYDYSGRGAPTRRLPLRRVSNWRNTGYKWTRGGKPFYKKFVNRYKRPTRRSNYSRLNPQGLPSFYQRGKPVEHTSIGRIWGRHGSGRCYRR